jgi:hypothetical protein
MFAKCSLGLLVLFFATTLAPVPPEKSRLTFTQDGKDLVVSTTVKANNSQHVLWTHATVQGKKVLLRYYVFQNRDLFVKGDKTIKVEWRLPNRKKDDCTFRVEEKFEPDSAELMRLLPQLGGLNKDQERPLPPCHPGCFPAGTIVQTPAGPRAIDKVRAGDMVLSISPNGKAAGVKVASVFVGRAMLVEVETATGKLLTTAKQPLLLSDGKIKSAGALTGADAIVRWQEGRFHNIPVHGVKEKTTHSVYNLVLEVRGTFLANGYLVQSKPPAEK